MNTRVLIGPPPEDPSAPSVADLDRMDDVTQHVVALHPDSTETRRRNRA